MSEYFYVNNEYEYYDTNTNQVIYLGSYVKSELTNNGSHASVYDFYFNNNGITYSLQIAIHPANLKFSGIRKKSI
jgi:hypothetical protein